MEKSLYFGPAISPLGEGDETASACARKCISGSLQTGDRVGDITEGL